MKQLVEVTRGTWIDPKTVVRIVAFTGSDAYRKWGRYVPPVLPQVVVTFNDRETLRWSCLDIDEAVGLAKWIGALVNGSHEPDDPNRKEIPISNVVKLGFKGT
jgi:hypothetical protein